MFGEIYTGLSESGDVKLLVCFDQHVRGNPPVASFMGLVDGVEVSAPLNPTERQNVWAAIGLEPTGLSETLSVAVKTVKEGKESLHTPKVARVKVGERSYDLDLKRRNDGMQGKSLAPYIGAGALLVAVAVALSMWGRSEG